MKEDNFIQNDRRDLYEDTMGYKIYLAYCAAKLAENLHAGQKDKAGADYFSGHLSTVGRNGSDWKEKVVGFLHDAAEDTQFSVDEVITKLKEYCADFANCSDDERNAWIEKYEDLINSYPQKELHPITDEEYAEIAEALNLMNQKTAGSREEYISRFANHVLAIKVKLHDLKHNMDISRISTPTEKDYKRVDRYKKEYECLLRMLDDICNKSSYK